MDISSDIMRATVTDLYRDICINPRNTEHSCRVARVWNSAAYPYKADIPAVKPGKEQCRERYLAITAECLLYREKILGLPTPETLARADEILSARPFGSSAPTYGELSNPQVRMAAAFVPLTPNEGCSSDDPVLTRLYCVSGLRGRYSIPFIDGADEAGIWEFSWFLSGIERDSKDGGIVGRSWLLAANLLIETIKRNDVATARNLISNFIVTGDVANGAITKVVIGRKQELDKPEFRNYKWIVPMKNANEMNLISSRRIEKPETLEDAYKLIESMKSKATYSFFRFMKQHDLVGMSHQYDIGADIFAVDTETGFSPLEYITRAINEKREMLGGIPKVYKNAIMCGDDDEKRTNWNKRLELARELKTLECIHSWLKAMDANCPSCIYMLAKFGFNDALEKVLQSYPVNAKDENGLTATDMAIIGGEVDATRKLIDLGGKCDAMGTRNFTIGYVLKNIRNMTERMWSSLELALDAGLSLDARSSFVDCETDGKGSFWDTWKLRLPLCGRAIYEANERLLRLCVSHGMDLNKPFLVEYLDDEASVVFTPEDVVNGKDPVIDSEMMSPLKFAYVIGNSSSVEMLKRLGARETEEVRVFLAERDEKKLRDRHERFIRAIGKLCGKDDSKENRQIVRECIEQGESVSAIVEGVRLAAIETDNGVPCYVQAPLYAVAILRGWPKMLKACLDAGMPLKGKVSFTLDCDYGEEVFLYVNGMGYEKESFRKGDVVARWTPMEIAERCDKAKRCKIVEILEQADAKR